jgi:hypothetical protein
MSITRRLIALLVAALPLAAVAAPTTEPAPSSTVAGHISQDPHGKTRDYTVGQEPRRVVVAFERSSAAKREGLASKYPFDKGIAGDPAVVHYLDVDKPIDQLFVVAPDDWGQSRHFDWTKENPAKMPTSLGRRWAVHKEYADKGIWPKKADASTTTAGYKPIHANAPRALMYVHKQGTYTATDAALFFKPTRTGDQREPFDAAGVLPQRLFLRWQLFLGDDFYALTGDPGDAGGKLGPGFMHKSNIGGWGGRSTVGGKIGWTQRNNFVMPTDPDSPLHRGLVLGAYPYNAESWQASKPPWGFNYRGGLLRGRWYDIETEIVMNVIGHKNGELRAWIDGVLTFDRKGIYWRGEPPWNPAAGIVADQGILGVWWNTYFGGQKGGAPRAGHHFIRGLVVASEYIGPMAR